MRSAKQKAKQRPAEAITGSAGLLAAAVAAIQAHNYLVAACFVGLAILPAVVTYLHNKTAA